MMRLVGSPHVLGIMSRHFLWQTCVQSGKSKRRYVDSFSDTTPTQHAGTLKWKGSRTASPRDS
jgi:hypothetical protein